MNLELMRKFKKELNWLLEKNDRTCMVKLKEGWVSRGIRIFEHNHSPEIEAIVINDNFSKYRMAQADGKIVEWYHACTWIRGAWAFDVGSDEKYRIVNDINTWSNKLSPANHFLCKVWDGKFDSPAPKKLAFIYRKREDEAYRDIYNESWDNAIPIKAGELSPDQRKDWIEIKRVIAILLSKGATIKSVVEKLKGFLNEP